MIQLKSSVAIVTGAGGGIGRALCLAFASAGASVVGADLDPRKLAETNSLLAETGAPCLTQVTDVSDADAVDSLADAAISHFGSADVICSNAGVARPGAIWEQPSSTWDRVMGVNLMGAVNLANTFVPLMIQSGREGRFVTTVGVAALFTAPFAPPGSYSVSKHALLAFSEILHQELRAIGVPVGVTVLCPSGVRSEILADLDAADGQTVRGAYARSRLETLYGFVQRGLEPSDVAGQTVAAVQANQFWVFPHPDHVARIQHRADYIQAASEPTSPM